MGRKSGTKLGRGLDLVRSTPLNSAPRDLVLSRIIGISPAIEEVRKDICIASEVGLPVLICGECGTGKELVANALHMLGSRGDKPYVIVNCATIPEGLAESELFGHVKGAFTSASQDHAGKFHAADQGTLFLDEIGELPMSIQAKLLRILQTGEVERVGSNNLQEIDVRIIAATNRNVDGGEFRSDLKHRLCGYRITIPPLREHLEDLPVLTRHFVNGFNQKYEKCMSIDDEAVTELRGFEFPGNIRELKNIVECSALIALFSKRENICSNDIVQAVRKLNGITNSDKGKRLIDITFPMGTTRWERIALVVGNLPEMSTDVFEMAIILETLIRNGWSKTKTSKILGINRKTLLRKLTELTTELGVTNVKELEGRIPEALEAYQKIREARGSIESEKLEKQEAVLKVK